MEEADRSGAKLSGKKREGKKKQVIMNLPSEPVNLSVTRSEQGSRRGGTGETIEADIYYWGIL